MLARGGSDGRQPGFRQWWRGGAGNRPALGQARARLERHMPELVPAWQRLTAMIDGPGADGDAGPALALWNPPHFLTGCSQAAVMDGGPALIRNYDWDYRLFDGVVARTAMPGTGCSACWTACGGCARKRAIARGRHDVPSLILSVLNWLIGLATAGLLWLPASTAFFRSPGLAQAQHQAQMAARARSGRPGTRWVRQV